MIASFIAGKMNAYIAGGMTPESAARFTRGELGAIYKGRHYSRGASGTMRLTPLPENISIEAAREKCTAALNKVLRTYTDTGKETPKAPENVPEAPKPKPRREGLDAIKEILLAGANVIGAFPSGAFIAKGEDFPSAFTADAETIAALMAGKGDKQGRAKGQRIDRFRFCPAPAGLLCLDIDRGHENEKDGLKEFYAMFENAGTPRAALPGMLRGIETGTFPVYTATPRGGFHLFFRYSGSEVKKGLLAPNVEIFHANAYLTAPGSVKDGRPYVLHGSLADAPEIPPIIARRLPKAKPAEQPQRKAVFNFGHERASGTPGLEQIAAWAEQDKAYSGKNELCHEIALRAARDAYNYSADEVIAFLKTYPSTSGHAQINDAVRSAFRYMGKS
jgi:hypothetical protein